MPYGWEWHFALQEGWDDVEFEALYADYVRSTQVRLVRGDDATALKGRPLEEVVRYFLRNGGAVTSIREISAHGRWQVDGQGPLNLTAIRGTWGPKIAERVGIQLYMESKNHSDPASNRDFAVHCQRMTEHDCQVGVFVSTSGYSISGGRGIADSVRENYLRDIFHLLLAFPHMREVIAEAKPPLAILSEVLCHAMNDRYAHDPEIQDLYSPEYCQRIAEEEYERLFSDDQ